MPVAPFVPLISTGIGALFGAKGSDTPSQATTQAQGQTIGQAQGAAGDVSNLSKYLQTQGRMTAPALGRAMGYYETLLNGNRSAMNQAVAPESGRITDASKGAAMNLERMGVTGGQKQQAQADLARQTGGQLGQLTLGMRSQAAGALSDIGKTGLGLSGQALQGFGRAGDIYTNILRGQGQLENQQYGRQQDVGRSIGSLIGPAVDAFSGKFGGGFRAGDRINMVDLSRMTGT